MALLADRSRKQFWDVNANGHRITELPVGSSSRAPGYYGIRTDYYDGDGNGGVGSGSSSERAELQKGGPASYGTLVWVRWMEKFDVDWPINETGEDWCYCIQWHFSAGGTYAPIAMNVYGDRRSIRCNPDNGAWVNRGSWPLARGQEVEWRLGILWSTGSNGRIIAYRDNVKVLDFTGKTGNTVETPYAKIGVYRTASKDGHMGWSCWGMQFFDADPGPFTGGGTGGGGGTTEPPPATVPDYTVTGSERLIGWSTGVADFQPGSGNAKRGSVVNVTQACQLIGYAVATRGGTSGFNARLGLYQAGAADFRDEPLVAGSTAPVVATAAGASDAWRRTNLTTPILLTPGLYRATAQFDAAGTYAITRNQGGMAFADDPYANGLANTFGGESTTFSDIDQVNGLQVVLIVTDPPTGSLAADMESDTAIAATLEPVDLGRITDVVYVLREEIVRRRVIPLEVLPDGSIGGEVTPLGDGTFIPIAPNPGS